MNPFELNARSPEQLIMNWRQLTPVPYDKHIVDPYTRCRVILMNGTEFEAVWYAHQFSRHSGDNELRRQIALLRRLEQQQQKLVAALKPADETILEHTIGYEQLAVDLTAGLAQREDNPYVKQALDFALLEDFDHLYRYADLMEFDDRQRAEALVGRYTEIMPGRPTIAHHRHPYDSVKFHIQNNAASPMTRLGTAIITAAEQQTMNYYMNVASFYPTAWGQKLYREIGMVEEQHVTQYGSLIDPAQTWLECLLNHQYTECYLYWSAMETEPDARLRGLWEALFEQETGHLQLAVKLLREYEGRDWTEVIPGGAFPAPLELRSNIEYVRGVLKNTVTLTADRESWINLDELAPDADFYRYQADVHDAPDEVESHLAIQRVIDRDGRDYRFETRENPVPRLRNRARDDTALARVPEREPATVR